ncbi:hypothetical protein DQ04_07991040 [Trypanosoma grayi]|uniref:hypothetical protein n=1 Tax=Trypanosoma grayi TaxID=71804 RepID=UPI0004F4782B|nr:hypothetical protein DQ04_07991040 [Trypanosoma grayi]KEG08109.1 hypothetical protein DQ04_07991040 [Trypanosoma grayi]
MRLSYGDHLIELDRQRRAKAYGRGAKRFHLKFLAASTALVYAVARLAAWVYPKKVTHAWIDDVLVEVTEDDVLERVCAVVGCICAASLLLLAFLTVRKGTRQPSPLARGPRVATNNSQRAKGWSAPSSSIAVPATTLFGGMPKIAAPLTVAAGGQHQQQERQRQQLPISSEAELNSFLQSKELAGGSGGRGDEATAAATAAPRSAATTAAAATTTVPTAFGGPLVGAAMAVRPSDGIRVQYRGGGEQQPAAQPVDSEWDSLGILSAERSLLKVRTWLSDLCHDLAEEMAACDRWFAEQQIGFFDCRHTLQEVIPVPQQSAPAATAGVGFGFGSASAAAPAAPAPTALRKLEALLNERQRLAGQAQNVQNFDTISHLDQRLLLESKLDPSGTFPPASSPSVGEQQARRQYIIKRLRTFASQKTLASYKHNRGDADLWRDDLPTDAHLLIHIVRICVEGFANYVKFPHQPMNAQQDLALFVGDTGEPYFYVRYRNGTIDKTYATHQGSNSLFEALLIFAAIVRTYHNASYGGIWGVMDLSRTGLLRVL